MNPAVHATYRKPKVVILAGYLYLSDPIYYALRDQLSGFNVVYYFAKDILGADINHDSDEYKNMSFDGVNCIQLNYTPKWFRSVRSAWYGRTFFSKAQSVLETILDLKGYRESFIRDMEKLKPDIVICTSDIFYTSRIVKIFFPKIPLFILQPCYIDLSERDIKYKTIKTLANLLFKQLFNRQPYFGLEIKDASLLVWDGASFDFYSARRQNVHKVINPVHTVLYNKFLFSDVPKKKSMMNDLGLNICKRTLIIFVSHYETLYGKDFQYKFEQVCKSVILNAKDNFNIIVKVHPNARIKYWEDVFGPDVMKTVHFYRDIDKETLLQIAEITLATNSYASVEAALAGLLTINYLPKDSSINTENFASMGKCYTCEASSAEDIINFLDALQDEKYFKDNVELNKINMREQFFNSNSKLVEDLLRDAYCK